MIKVIKSKYKFCGNCNEPASQFFYVIAGFGKGKPLCLSCIVEELMIIKNKWNGRLYTVISINEHDNTVTLERDDDSQFTIQAKEVYANYREVEDEQGKD